MFDTSVVHARSISPTRRFTFLAASLGVHTIAVVAAVAMSVASTQLPTTAPRQLAVYRPVDVPRIPQAYGRPDARPRTASQNPAPRQQTAPLTAPNVIPDATPVAVATGPATEEAAPDGPVGVPWGDPNSVSTGEPVVETPTPQEPPKTYTPGGGVTAARVLRRVDPRYPNVMIATRMAAVVTVRCIIDRSGAIRDPQIVQSSYPPFNEAVLDAVRQWQFAPGTLHGQPVDTWFELTVRFVMGR